MPKACVFTRCGDLRTGAGTVTVTGSEASAEAVRGDAA